MEKLAITPAPQLSYAPSKEMSPDYSKRSNQVEDQPIGSDPKAETPKTAHINPSSKDDEGLFEKILSLFKK